MANMSDGFTIIERIPGNQKHPIYKARRRDEFFAIKAIPLEPDRQLAERLTRQAHLQSQIRHPYILQIHMTYVHESTILVLMELADGGSLSQLLDGHPWPIHKAARMVEGIARGVHAVHEKGYVHHDLNPSHVLLCGGHPKLTGFGKAKKNTEGEIGQDLHCAGAILYEMLTGNAPTSLARPDQLHPDVPAELAAICLKCLRNEYTSAADLADDLKAHS